MSSISETPPTGTSGQARPHIEVRGLTLAYGDFVIQRDLNFTIRRGDVFVIMGGSGCGKSTLMRSMIGLMPPTQGKVVINGVSFWNASTDTRDRMMHRSGVTYQGAALWSSMTLAENVALPLEQYTELPAEMIRDLVELKLSLVGLAGFGDYYPSEISGGMRKRAGLARAIALDPDILFFDEPSAGLDPISSRRLDDLIAELRDSLGATVVLVTHELPTIFGIGNNSVFLDTDSRTQLATGDPNVLVAESPDPRVRAFLTRGEFDASALHPSAGEKT